jgi:hypothetical protein
MPRKSTKQQPASNFLSFRDLIKTLANTTKSVVKTADSTVNRIPVVGTVKKGVTGVASNLVTGTVKTATGVVSDVSKTVKKVGTTVMGTKTAKKRVTKKAKTGKTK